MKQSRIKKYVAMGKLDRMPRLGEKVVAYEGGYKIIGPSRKAAETEKPVAPEPAPSKPEPVRPEVSFDILEEIDPEDVKR